eukprot:COSAG06_NODE_5321_length_3558_cov_2.036138_3_plen_58_part_00
MCFGCTRTQVAAMQRQLTKALFGANFSPTAYFTDPFDGQQKCVLVLVSHTTRVCYYY